MSVSLEALARAAAASSAWTAFVKATPSPCASAASEPDASERVVHDVRLRVALGGSSKRVMAASRASRARVRETDADETLGPRRFERGERLELFDAFAGLPLREIECGQLLARRRRAPDSAPSARASDATASGVCF